MAGKSENDDKDALEIVQRYRTALTTFRKLQTNHEQARRQAQQQHRLIVRSRKGGQRPQSAEE